MRVFGRLMDGLLDRLNPILVKEVRQAVRGRYFKVSYGITLAAATTITVLLMVVAEIREAGSGRTPDLGSGLFNVVFCCLSGAVFFWVPFFGFISMGSEWEENTFDLLVLSNLRPRQIVYGKLWSCAVQTLLYFSAFGPFLVLTFLLRGIDLLHVLLLLAGALGYSLSLSLMSLGVSSLSRHRFLRISLMSLAAAGLAVAAILAITFALTAVGFRLTTTADLALFVSVAVSITLSLGLLGGEVACVRLSHPEENRSTGLRVLVCAVTLVGLGWLAYIYIPHRARSVEVLPGVLLTTLVFLLVPGTFFSTEPERLGRRVRLHVPRNRLLALLCTPFLPGGGRGLLYWLMMVGVVLGGGAWIQHASGGSLAELRSSGLYAVLATALYGFLYLALPVAFFYPRHDALKWRIFSRLLIPVSACLAFLVPTLVLYFAGSAGSGSRPQLPNQVLGHPGASPAVISGLWDGDREGEYALFLGLAWLALFTLLMNAPRLVAGVRDVLAASSERRAREQRGARPVEPAVVDPVGAARPAEPSPAFTHDADS